MRVLRQGGERAISRMSAGGPHAKCKPCGRGPDLAAGRFWHGECTEAWERRVMAGLCERCGKAADRTFCASCDPSSPYVGYPEGG